MPTLGTIQPTRKLLALDGGGIRGTITIEILAKMERLLQQQLQRDDTFVLADYFDYISGTSTGAIIATCLSLGMRIDTIRDFYQASGSAMFDKASLLDRFRYKYHDEKLAEKLKTVIGADTTLGSPKLKTLLLLIMRNATTDSPWPVSSNPRAEYNQPTRPDCNLHFPLWQLVRASTAAPTYFPPETITIGQHHVIFVDGGVTMYNNPAFQLFLMATIPAYRLEWPTGEDRLLLVSVGTGSAANANANLAPHEMNLLYNAGSIPSALMYAAANEQDFLCRVFGHCRYGAVLDREVGDLCAVKGPGDTKLFSYVRYNADLSERGLAKLGLPHIRPEHVQQMDSVAYTGDLQTVGRAVADRDVDAGHFSRFIG
ncbi:patatin-like phospholipase family protein [Spirosoma arcticum]